MKLSAQSRIVLINLFLTCSLCVLSVYFHSDSGALIFMVELHIKAQCFLNTLYKGILIQVQILIFHTLYEPFFAQINRTDTSVHQKDAIESAVRATTATTWGGKGGGSTGAAQDAQILECCSQRGLLHNKRCALWRTCCVSSGPWFHRFRCTYLAHFYQPVIRDFYCEILNNGQLACRATQKGSAGRKWATGRR